MGKEMFFLQKRKRKIFLWERVSGFWMVGKSPRIDFSFFFAWSQRSKRPERPENFAKNQRLRRKQMKLASLRQYLFLFAKAFEQREAVFVAGVEQFPEGFYFQFFPDGSDLFGAQAFDLQHFHDAGRGDLNVVIEEGQAPAEQEFLYIFKQGFSYAFDLFHFFQWHAFEGQGQLIDGEGGAAKGFGFEGVFPVNVHEFRQQGEAVGDRAIIHGCKIPTKKLPILRREAYHYELQIDLT